MKNHLITILILAAGCLSASAQLVQYVTISVTADASNNYFSNSYAITQNQAAELMHFQGQGGQNGYNGNFYSSLLVSRGGAVFQNVNGGVPPQFYPADNNGNQGTIIQGPATFTLIGSAQVNSFVTLKIIPEAYDPNKTLIVPPGTNQVQITLQLSPDLVNWTTATNGVYGSPTTAQFFRIREDNLVAP